MDKYQNDEFISLIEDILENKEFQKTKDIAHHGITRYDHSMRVAYFSYIITKKLHLDYKETTEAALLHDFFTTEVENEGGIQRLRHHPTHAAENAKKYFNISDKQIDIIKTHMFPVTFTPPKYIESWIVDLVDDVSAIYEKSSCIKTQLQAATTFLFLVVVNVLTQR